MAFVVKGLYELDSALADIVLVGDDTYDEMLNAAADVMVSKTSHYAETMLHGPYYTGDLVKNIKKGKIRKNAKNGRYTDVIFRGVVRDKHHKRGERRAKIAFINEYGTRKQPARPFISMALRTGSDEALNAAAEVYFDKIDKTL